VNTIADFVTRLRNPYREEDYFTLNVRNGVVRAPTGTRILSIPEELISGLHEGLEEECGAASSIVLYQCGKWWGKQFVKHQAHEIRHFFSEEAADLPLAVYLQVLRRVWSMYGWGALDVSFELKSHGFIEICISDAMYSSVVGNVGRTSDHIFAGVLASIVSDLAGRELECVETACRSRGDKRCFFLVGIKTRTEIVATLVKQGTPHAQIVETIGRGEVA
jgi:uncharacterized protein